MTKFLYNQIITTYKDSEVYKYAISDYLTALSKLLYKL
jgi:hypothetical protein